jgi:hypothetical protein
MDFEQNSPVMLQTSTAFAAAPGKEPSPAQEAHSDLESLLAALEHERITALAYFLWQQRGCPEGSPDEDWFQAQQHIRESR